MWPPDELSRIGAAVEVDVAPRRPDGSVGRRVTIWVVPVENGLYVRSWKGRGGAWFRGVEATRRGRLWAAGLERDVAFLEPDRDVDGAVDAGFLSKYGSQGGGYAEEMVTPEVRRTTLQMVPAEAAP